MKTKTGLCRNYQEDVRLKITIPTPPKPMELPTDSTAAWVNGYRAAASNCEQALDGLLPYMSQTFKSRLISRQGLNVEIFKPTSRVTRTRVKNFRRLSCGHGYNNIEKTGVENQYICTLCGLTGFEDSVE